MSTGNVCGSSLVWDVSPGKICRVIGRGGCLNPHTGLQVSTCSSYDLCQPG